MKINLTKKQFESLIEAFSLGHSVLGILGDAVTGLIGKKYKEKSQETEKLEGYLLQFAKDFGHKEMVQKYDDKVIMKDDFYEKTVSVTLDEYENFVTFDNLANELAWRDFYREHSPKEIRELKKKDKLFGLEEVFKTEEKYHQEFEKYGIDRLELRDN